MFENSSFGSPELNFSELSYHFKLWFMSTMIIFSLENVILKEKESSCTKSPCISRGLRLLLRPKFEGSYFCRLRDPELLFSAMVHSISHPLGDKMMKDLSQLGFHWKSHTNMRNVILHFGHCHHIPLHGFHQLWHNNLLFWCTTWSM